MLGAGSRWEEYEPIDSGHFSVSLTDPDRVIEANGTSASVIGGRHPSGQDIDIDGSHVDHFEVCDET